MPSLRDETARQDILCRLQRLTPAAKPRWGKLDAPRMLCHLIDALALSLGDVTAPSMNRKAFHHFPLKHLILYVFPFPKGAPSSPEFFSTLPRDFVADRQRVVELIDRLAMTPNAKRPVHPLFGPLTMDEWNSLQWKHIAHHLKQFGG